VRSARSAVTCCPSDVLAPCLTHCHTCGAAATWGCHRQRHALPYVDAFTLHPKALLQPKKPTCERHEVITELQGTARHNGSGHVASGMQACKRSLRPARTMRVAAAVQGTCSLQTAGQKVQCTTAQQLLSCDVGSSVRELMKRLHQHACARAISTVARSSMTQLTGTQPMPRKKASR
jgi:hypothetical protein